MIRCEGIGHLVGVAPGHNDDRFNACGDISLYSVANDRATIVQGSSSLFSIIRDDKPAARMIAPKPATASGPSSCGAWGVQRCP